MKRKNNKRMKPVQKQVVQQKPKALTRAEKTKRMVLVSILSALVIVLAWLSTFLKLGTVPLTLTLVPVVIGAALCDTRSAVWLGFVSACTALVTTFMDPFSQQMFVQPNIGGTVITVFAKGMFAGLAAACVYRAVAKKNKYLGVFAAGIVCPLVNTGIFLLGCVMFFLQPIETFAESLGEHTWKFILFGFAGINFLVELAVNMVLSPAIIRLLNIRKK